MVQYIYLGHYHIESNSEHTVDFRGFFKGTPAEKTQADHIVIYVLADRLLMHGLKYLALERFKDSNVTPSVHHLRFLAEALYGDVIGEDDVVGGARGGSKKAITGAGRETELIEGVEEKVDSTKEDTDHSKDDPKVIKGEAVNPSEKSNDEGERKQDDKTDCSFDFKQLKTQDAPQTQLVTRSIDDEKTTRKQIAGMKRDSRRELQKLFATLVHKDLWTLRKSPYVEELLFEGGPFALDLFTLDAPMMLPPAPKDD